MKPGILIQLLSLVDVYQRNSINKTRPIQPEQEKTYRLAIAEAKRIRKQQQNRGKTKEVSMANKIYTFGELHAYSILVSSGRMEQGTESGKDARWAANYILHLAEQIKNERTTATIVEAYKRKLGVNNDS